MYLSAYFAPHFFAPRYFPGNDLVEALVVSVDEFRAHARLGNDDSYEELSAILIAAQELVAEQAGLTLLPTTRTLKLDGFSDCGSVIRLPYPPVRSITSITYVDGAGATQTWPADHYGADLDSVPPVIFPAYGRSWPYSRWQRDGVTVTYEAGYANPASVPATLKHAIKLLAAHWYENRDGLGESIPSAVKALINLNRVYL